MFIRQVNWGGGVSVLKALISVALGYPPPVQEKISENLSFYAVKIHNKMI